MKKGTNSHAYDFGSRGVNSIFHGERALKVEHPDNPPSWFYRESGTYLLYRDGETYEGTVNEEDIVRIADHSENLWEVVPLEESPFGGD